MISPSLSHIKRCQHKHAGILCLPLVKVVLLGKRVISEGDAPTQKGQADFNQYPGILVPKMFACGTCQHSVPP